MTFDIKTAQPIKQTGGFDISTASPVKTTRGFKRPQLPLETFESSDFFDEDIFNVLSGTSPKQQVDFATKSIIARGGQESFESFTNLAGAAIQQSGKDLFSIPANFFNQYFFNAPRSALQTFTPFKFPEEADNRAIDFIRKGAGIVGLVKSPITRKLGLTRPGLSLAERSARQAAAGFAFSSEKFDDIRTRGIQALTGAAFPFVANAVTKAGRGLFDFIRAFGGVFPETAKQTIRVGPDRVAQKGIRQAGFFTKNLVPRVQREVNKLLTKVDEKTESFFKLQGATAESINTLKKVGIGKLRQVQQKFAGGTGQLVKNINEGLEQNLKRASDGFDDVFNRSKGAKIGIKNTFFRLQKKLKDINVLDEQGGRKTGKFGNRTIDSLVDIYDDMRQDLGAEFRPGQKVSIKNISKTEYNRLRIRLNGAISGLGEVDRFVFDTLGSLRKDAANSIKGLKNVFKMYSSAKQQFDKNHNKITEALLRRKRMDLQTFNRLREVNKSLPESKKFLKDLNNIKAGEEILGIADDNLNVNMIEKNLKEFSKFKDPGIGKMQEIRRLYGNFTDREITDDALGHFLAKDLFQETVGTGFLAVAGLLRKGAEAATRFGLKRQAQLRPVGRAIRRTLFKGGK